MNNEYVQSTATSAETAYEAMRGNGPRPETMPVGQAEAGMTMEWVVTKMEAIIHDNEHIAEALKSIAEMRPQGEHDQATNSKAAAVAKVIAARETTNQQALKFLEKIYDDLKPTTLKPESLLKSIDLAMLAENLESQHVVDIVRFLSLKN